MGLSPGDLKHTLVLVVFFSILKSKARSVLLLEMINVPQATVVVVGSLKRIKLAAWNKLGNRNSARHTFKSQ